MNPLVVRRPCPTPDAPQGDGPILYCATCDAAVIDFAALTADETASLQQTLNTRGRCGRIAYQGGRRVHRARRHARSIALALGVGIGGLAVAHAAIGVDAVSAADPQYTFQHSIEAAIAAAESFGVAQTVSTDEPAPAPASVPSEAEPAPVPPESPTSEAKKDKPCEELDDGREVIPGETEPMILLGGL